MQTAVLPFVSLLIYVVIEASVAADSPLIAPAIPAEDYVLYDRVVRIKFLTSETRLVMIERMTVSRLFPDREGSMTTAFFHRQNYFNGALPPDLVRDFVRANQDTSRLEGRFRFGVPYQFVYGGGADEADAMSAFPAKTSHRVPALASSVLDRLAFSRVGRMFGNDGALLYVENIRPNGTGAGFLVWFRRQGQELEIYETEVLWVVRTEEGFEESP